MLHTLTWKRVLGTRLKVPFFFSMSQRQAHRLFNVLFNIVSYWTTISVVAGIPLFIMLPVPSGVILYTYFFSFFLIAVTATIKYSREVRIISRIRFAVNNAVEEKIINHNNEPDLYKNLSYYLDDRILIKNNFVIDNLNSYQLEFISRMWNRTLRDESILSVQKQSGGTKSTLNKIPESDYSQEIFKHFHKPKKDADSSVAS